MRKLLLLSLLSFSLNSFAVDFVACRNWATDNGNVLGYALKIQNIAKSISYNLKSIQNDRGMDSETSREILKHSAHIAYSLNNQFLYLAIVMQQSFTAKVSAEIQAFTNETISNTFIQVGQQIDYLNSTIPLIQNSANTRELMRFREILEEIKMRTSSCK